MSTRESSVMPLSICVHGVSRLFEIKWCDATRSLLSHRELRLHCKCAACEQARRAGQSAMPAEDIAITDVSAVGAMGLQLHFSDGHSQGIFPFAFLRELGRTSSA
jgi:DUF971 family protein